VIASAKAPSAFAFRRRFCFPTRAKGCLSNKTALAMIFKLAEAAEKSWRRLDGHNQLPKIILGIKFTDGIEVVSHQDSAIAPIFVAALTAPMLPPCTQSCDSLSSGQQFPIAADLFAHPMSIYRRDRLFSKIHYSSSPLAHWHRPDRRHLEWRVFKQDAEEALTPNLGTNASVAPTVRCPIESTEGAKARPKIDTVTGWLDIGVPKGTPAEIVERLNREVNAGLADATVKARMAELGSEILPARSPNNFINPVCIGDGVARAQQSESFDVVGGARI
jgi:hypothetical protein